MDIIDIFLGCALGFGAYKGIKNGLFVELASLISFFVGVFMAIKFSSAVASVLATSVSRSPKTIKTAAFLITLIAVVIAIHLLAKVFSKIANLVFLGGLNKFGGAVFAVLKTALLLGILLNLFLKVNINNAILSKERQEKSLFLNPILKTSSFLLPVLGDWLADLKGKTSDSLKK